MTEPAPVPDGWRQPTPQQVERAAAFAITALADDGDWPVRDRLADFYRLDGNYAGATFAAMQPNDPRDITAADLHAATLLQVAVEPRATRRLLDDGGHRRDVLDALAALDDTGVTSLTDAGPVVLDAMDQVFRAVRAACQNPHVANPNPWVTVSKLCARKKPGLFPVRDNVVCTALGLIGKGQPVGDWQLDWQVYAQLLEHRDVWPRLDAAIRYIASLPSGEYAGDVHELRILDAALWTYENSRGRAERAAQRRRRSTS
jgi:hypothetical protein